MKKILLSILISVIGLVGFGYCGFLFSIKGTSNSENLVANGGTTEISGYNCFNFNNTNCYSNLKIYDIDGNLLGNNFYTTNQSNAYFCINGGTYVIENNRSSDCLMYQRSYTDYGLCSCPTCEEQYTSEECQQEYSLMPISSCDSEFCGLNGLCPEYTGSVMSQLYINGIEHLSAPMINITIPMEVQRNYEYTGVNEDIFDLDIGSQQGDESYIQGIIDVNSYRPTSEDFTNTFVGGLTLIFPYIIVTAFIVFIWRFIRKIFK